MPEKIKNTLKPTQCWQRDYLRPLIGTALPVAWEYSTPQEAWNNWEKQSEMVWLLKRLNIDNRQLSQCLLEIFEHYHPAWRGRFNYYPMYKLSVYITAVREYIAGKKELSFLRRKFNALNKTREQIETVYLTDPSNKSFNCFRNIAADTAILLHRITHGYLGQCQWGFSVISDEIDLKTSLLFYRNEELHAWARDHIRKYFPDPTIFLAEVLYD
jgi:hypothetical protein